MAISCQITVQNVAQNLHNIFFKLKYQLPRFAQQN